MWSTVPRISNKVLVRYAYFRRYVLFTIPQSLNDSLIGPTTCARRPNLPSPIRSFFRGSQNKIVLISCCLLRLPKSRAASKVLMRSLGFEVRRAEVPLIVHRANPEADGQVDLQTFRTISEDCICRCCVVVRPHRAKRYIHYKKNYQRKRLKNEQGARRISRTARHYSLISCHASPRGVSRKLWRIRRGLHTDTTVRYRGAPPL